MAGVPGMACLAVPPQGLHPAGTAAGVAEAREAIQLSAAHQAL